ncbi:hypothetical protein [Lacticaseibacillus mingshuiensis]|uniref:hypothetical protein n=1 Tax=Lacticaseibacillus mingshuiensis TaxID=2799574 RepID=UPI00194DF743|nr:hypothetical protein [Lacticaseibacillus mingshuiensis]
MTKTSFPLEQLFANRHNVRDFLIVDEDDGRMWVNGTLSRNVMVEIIGEDDDIDQIRFVEVTDDGE